MAQNTNISESEAMTENTVHLIIGEVLNYKDTAEQLRHGEWYAQHNETAFKIAMAVAKFYDKQLQLRMDAYERERKAIAEIEKLKQELSLCRAMNADYLTAKTEVENRAKLLKKEVADLKVPESRQNRHLRDELHRSRLECQQAWEHANKEMAENKELRERNVAFKRQLDESNRQIEIYAKKVRNLEAELELDGGLG